MVEKLKVKVIVIIMSLISLILIATFTSLLISSYKRMEKDSYLDIEKSFFYQLQKKEEELGEIEFKENPRIKEESIEEFRGRAFEDPSSFATFFVALDKKGNIVEVEKGNYRIDEQVIQEVIQEALSGGKRGTIKAFDLRYLVFDNMIKDITVIGFIDVSFENSFLNQQLMNYLFIGSMSFIAFLIVSIILADIVIRPVEESFKRQKQFVSDAAHELKTPISVILANTSILLKNKEQLGEDNFKWIEYIDMEGNRMKGLVRDLLFLARSDANSLPELEEEIGLSDLVLQKILIFEAVLVEIGRYIESEIEEDIYIKGNRAEIEQLITILLDNANKYSKGTEPIKVRLYKEHQKSILRVNNASDPIPKEELQYIFDRFYKVDKARNTSDNSHGLGLAIAKDIVGHHKAEITVKSDHINGTTFSVIFHL